MTIQLLELPGCRSDVLAHYLKALAVFRIVGQKDATARAFWREGSFTLASSLGRTAVEELLLVDYVPTPLVAPWNGGSGFFPNDNREAIDALTTSTATRFAPYRIAIEAARTALCGLDESPKNEAKLALAERARRQWPSALLPWLDAALSLSDDGIRYPALLGTGGNDGRLDFTNNFMQRLLELFDAITGAPQSAARSLLQSSLFGDVVTGLEADIAIGQFLPGAAGGPNATAGFEGMSLVNPWDFVLALEGALSFQSAAVRRLDTRDQVQAAAPFAVRAAAAGYASAAAADESARGEQWMPLWSSPTIWAAFERVLREARLMSGRESAGSALEAAAALSRAGAARGIVAFQRFGYIERNGQANLAVPLGLWRVEDKASVSLIDAVEQWVSFLRFAGDAVGAPAGISRRARVLQRAMLDVLRQPTTTRVERLLVGLGEAEDAIARSGRWAADKGLRPLPLIDESVVAPWLIVTEPEVEVARCLAALEGVGGFSLRWNCLPLGDRPGTFRAASDRLTDSADVVWDSDRLVISLAAVAARRINDAGDSGFPFLAPRFTAKLETINQFIAGELDDLRIARLARPLMAIRWSSADHPGSSTQGLIDPRFAACRLAWNGVPLTRAGTYRADPLVPKLLARGKGNEAFRAAERRLAAWGLRLRVDSRTHAIEIGAQRARRMAAALLIPISRADTAALVASLRRQPEVSTLL